MIEGGWDLTVADTKLNVVGIAMLHPTKLSSQLGQSCLVRQPLKSLF